MPSRFPLPWTLEKQAERGNSYSSRRAGLYVMPDDEHRIAPCVIAALTSLVHDGQSAADYSLRPPLLRGPEAYPE